MTSHIDDLLKRLRDIATAINSYGFDAFTETDCIDFIEDTRLMADLFIELDDHIKTRNDIPQDWQCK